MPSAPFAWMLVALAAHGQTRDPDDVVAMVLGQEITVADAMPSEITGLIGDVLTRRFVEDNGLAPTDEELQAFVAGSLRAQREARLGLERQKVELEATLEGVLSPERRESVQNSLDTISASIERLSESQPEDANIDVVRAAAKVWVQRWKVFRALYEKYGGRAHYQQAGIEPFDAVREFLEEQEANGAFAILDPAYEEEFWHYWRNEDMHTFVPEGRERELIDTPWWLMAAPVDD